MLRSVRQQTTERLLLARDLMFDAKAIWAERSCRKNWSIKIRFGSGLPWAVLFLLIVGVTTLGWAQSLPKAVDSQSGIPFDLNPDFGSILIKAQVNGRPATLVVDSGSSHTILSAELLQVRPLALEHADLPGKGSGLVGSAGWGRATVEVGRVTWRNRKILVMNDFGELSKSMKRKVDGILGQDVLREFDLVVIDYKHHRLVLAP